MMMIYHLMKEGYILKRIVGILLACSILLFSACSTDKQSEATDATSKQETKVSSSEDSKKKEAAEAKKKAEEAEKKRQEEISKKVVEADAAMKTAEANPTDETIATAKTAIGAIPGGNTELSKRLEITTANLEAIKQQQAQIVVEQTQQQTYQQQDVQQQENPQVQESAQNAEEPVVITGAPPMTEEERQGREYYARLNEQLARENGVDTSQKAQTPPTHVDDQGRSYTFENHDAYKDEPYYTEDWKNNPSPYQD